MDQQHTKLKMVIVIPAYNEQDTIADVIKSIPDQFDLVTEKEVIVINDGSTDMTAEKAAEAGAKVVSFSRNRGLGAAFSQALRSALIHKADVIVNIDADGQFDPSDISTLIAPILEGQADMVTASRFADPELVPVMPWVKKWGNARVSNLVNRLAGQNLKDVSCGFRAYSRDAALRATLIGQHTYTHEIILDLAFRGFRIIEIPVKVRGVRKIGKSKVADNLWVYGWNSLVIMLRAFRDYRPMRAFGAVSLAFFMIGLLSGGFVAYHYFSTGSFSPYIFVAFMSGGSIFISLLCFITAMLADMLNRLRILQDEELFLLRKSDYQ